MTFAEYWSREQVEIRRKQVSAMQEAEQFIFSIEQSFGSYRKHGAQILRSSRLHLLGEIQSEQWSLNNHGMES